MLNDRIKAIIKNCEENAIILEERAKILREYANLQTQLNLKGAMIINREDKQSRLKELADRFNDLSLSNLFMSEL